MHPVSWKNSLFLSCSCNLQHSLEFTEHSVPSRDDSTPGEPVHSLGFQSSGINRDNCVRRKPTRPVGQGVWWVGMWVCPGAGRGPAVLAGSLQGPARTAGPLPLSLASGNVTGCCSGASQGPAQSSSWKGQRKSPCACAGDVHSLVVPMR